MIEAQDMKTEVMIAPTTVFTEADSAVGYLDTQGWEYATITTILSSGASTKYQANVLKITEGTNSAAASAVPAFTGTTNTVTSTSAGFLIPIMSTVTGVQGGHTWQFQIDLRKRERYLALTYEADTTCRASAVAMLSRGKQVPGADAGSVASGNEIVG